MVSENFLQLYAATFFIAVILLVMPLDLSQQDNIRLEDVEFQFVESSKLKKVNDTWDLDGYANGQARLNGDKVWIKNRLVSGSLLLICNHELEHVKGERHKEMGFFEENGLVMHRECLKLFHKIVL